MGGEDIDDFGNVVSLAGGDACVPGQRCVFGGAPMVAVECLGVGCYFLRIVFVSFSYRFRLVFVLLPSFCRN